jgi:hypothetical protein
MAISMRNGHKLDHRLSTNTTLICGRKHSAKVFSQLTAIETVHSFLGQMFSCINL